MENNYFLAKLHNDYDKNLIKIVLKQPIELVNAKATIESKKLHKLHKEVSNEIHRLKGFIRFESSKKGILYSKIETKHDIEKIIINFFMKRFPLMTIIISSNKGCFIARKNKIKFSNIELFKLIKELEKTIIDKERNFNFYDFDNKLIWEKYYKSQFIKERENKKLFIKNIPKKYLKNEFLAEEQTNYNICNNKKISDFNN
jgi:probable DNA metabolism protein